MATVKDTLIHEIIWDDGDAKKKADAWTQTFERNQSAAKTLADTFAKLGTALLEFTVEAGANFARFEDRLSHARRTMNLSRDDTLALGDALIDLSAEFGENALNAGIAADELVKISGILGQLGFSVERLGDTQFANLTATVGKLSIAFGFSSSKAGEFLGILSNLYDLPVDKLENVASSVTVLGNSTVATAQQILDVMQRMGGIAGILGVTSTEAAAIAATMREAGVSTQVAGTAMSQIFSRLASDVDKFGQVLGKGGVRGEMLRFQIESGNSTEALKSVLQAIQNINRTEGKIAAIQALKDLGLSGVRVQQSLLALSNNIAGLNTNLALSEQAFRENTAVNDAYQAAIDNTYQKWTQFKNLVDVITKLIGRDMSIAFGDFLQNHLIPFTRDVKRWLETSKTAEAIFGRDGLIANGLDLVGEKLTENKAALFAWLNIFDESGEQTVEALWKTIEDFFGNYKSELQAALNTVQSFTQTLKDIEEGWKTFVIAVKATLATIAATMNIIYQGLGKVVSVWNRITDGEQDAEEAIEGYRRGIDAATEALRIHDDVANIHSTWPDSKDGIIEVTKAAMGYRDTLVGLTGTTEFLYQTGERSWTNLFRNVESGNQLWRRSFDNIRDDTLTLEYNLYQTADAVTNLGNMYRKTGEDAKEAMTKATEATVQAAAGIEAVIAAQASISSGLASAGFGALSSTQLSSLTRSNNVFDTRGLANLTTLARTQQQPIAQQQGASINMTGGLPRKIVLNVDGEELTGVITTKQAERSQRVSGFGAGGGGFATSRGGF